jgi:hypothetical protein
VSSGKGGRGDFVSSGLRGAILGLPQRGEVLDEIAAKKGQLSKSKGAVRLTEANFCITWPRISTRIWERHLPRSNPQRTVLPGSLEDRSAAHLFSLLGCKPDHHSAGSEAEPGTAAQTDAKDGHGFLQRNPKVGAGNGVVKVQNMMSVKCVSSWRGVKVRCQVGAEGGSVDLGIAESWPLADGEGSFSLPGRPS